MRFELKVMVVSYGVVRESWGVCEFAKFASLRFEVLGSRGNSENSSNKGTVLLNTTRYR